MKTMMMIDKNALWIYIIHIYINLKKTKKNYCIEKKQQIEQAARFKTHKNINYKFKVIARCGKFYFNMSFALVDTLSISVKLIFCSHQIDI